MNQIKCQRSTRGYQARRRAESQQAAFLEVTSKSSLIESSYKTQLDLAVKGVLFESLYPLSRNEIIDRMTWLIGNNNGSKINRVVASLQRLITNKLVVATLVIEQGQEVTKYLLDLPYEDLQRARADRVRMQQLHGDRKVETIS